MHVYVSMLAWGSLDAPKLFGIQVIIKDCLVGEISHSQLNLINK